MKKNILYITLILGYLLLIAGALLWLSMPEWATIIFSVGAFFYAVSRLFMLPQSQDFRVRRLNLISIIGVVILAGGVYLMWEQKNSWVIALTLSIFIDLYSGFRYPKKK